MKIHRAVLMLGLTSAGLVARAADYPAPQAGNVVVKDFQLARGWRRSSCTITRWAPHRKPSRHRRFRPPIPDAHVLGSALWSRPASRRHQIFHHPA